MLRPEFISTTPHPMLQKPTLNEHALTSHIESAYALNIAELQFLPLGADSDTVVYRITSTDNTQHFLKLRSGKFDEASVTYPSFLAQAGVGHIIAPLPTKSGVLWTAFEQYKTILYPFVVGQDCYQTSMTEQHWGELAATLSQMHALPVPPEMRHQIKQETFSPQWRNEVKQFLLLVASKTFSDPVADKTARFLHEKRAAISELVARTEKHAQTLQAQTLEWVVCHSDLHAGNILISDVGALYVVDWDTLTIAPKERDLMYVGGGLLSRRTPEDEHALFYRSYGEVELNHTALAYYRYERIVQDIAEYCKALLLTDEGGEDREQSFGYLASNFDRNRTIEIAYRADGVG